MLKAQPDCCEECALGMGNAYIPCNKPATVIVDTGRKTEGPYRMCDMCADHSVKNRGMKIIGVYKPHDQKKTPV